MKKYIYITLIIFALVAYFVPGETIVQIGLRKIAIEQGIAAAETHHSWEATADAESMPKTGGGQVSEKGNSRKPARH